MPKHLGPIRTVAMLCMLAAAPAQSAGWHTGLRAGINAASIRGDFADIAGPNRKMGLVVGGVVENEFSPGVAVEANLLYVQKGATFESEYTDYTGQPLGVFESHLNLEYLEVPVLVCISLPALGSATPYLIGGPTVGIALRGRIKNEVPRFNPSEADVTDDLENVDLGVTGGVGLRFGQGRYRYAVETRYGTGFQDLWDFQDNLESINQGISVTFAVSR